jgi:hypothetical protein
MLRMRPQLRDNRPVADNLATYAFLGFGLIAIFIAARAFFDRKTTEPARYVGSQVHYDDVLATIDTVARRIVVAHAHEDEFAQTRRVRDELIVGKFRNADQYEAVILGVVKRLRGAEAATVREWTD